VRSADIRLLIQPEDGVRPLLDAIQGARRKLDLYVFRLDRRDISDALRDAVRRGVAVRALVAHTRRGGEKSARDLERALRRLGATVARTDDDLVRYHGKMMIVDRSTLYVLGYNLTRQDIEKSRSLGLVTGEPALVREALRLFQADFKRRRYAPASSRFVVSPLNARTALHRLIAGARRQLLVYDDRLTDRAMIRLLRQRAKAGVEVKVIGTMDRKPGRVRLRKLPGFKLHVRAIVQDGRRAFVGSQSLRRLELDDRREIGLVVDEPAVVEQIGRVFAWDWARAGGDKRKPAAFPRALPHLR
jgi:phosphatidylserine/phosphatidylglycerophosphate/cardiolipin synthase-like enzyme